jgi:phosphoribosylformimino-5-aminoimidazole carboxamide ribotide isomerase
MLAIPAIDIKDGKVVRLLQGRYTELIVYSHDPVEIAKTWQKEGAKRLHIIDLDGALAGEVKNIPILRQIVENIDIPVQFGGGLRSMEDVVAVLSIGVKWIILGTKACEDLDFIKRLIAEYKEQLIISIDVKYNKVAFRAWTETTNIDDVELIKRLQQLGIKSFIYTDISRDGTLCGFNIEVIKRILEQTGASIFYSGGIATVEDIKNLKLLENQGLAGIIIGKALYENKIHFMRAVKILEGSVD